MAGFTGAPPIVTDGLVFAVDAANYESYPGSGTTWSDLSGNGNNGTLTNGPTYSTDGKGSIVFDGANDYVSIPNTNFQFSNQELTYEIWVNFTDNPNTYRFLIGNDTPTTRSPRINFAKSRSGLNNGSVYMQLVIGSNRAEAIDNITGEDYTSLGITHFVGIIKYNGSVYQAQLYRNGDLISTGNSNLTTYDMGSTNVVTLGNALNESAPLNGSIYGARIYNRALTPSEISQNYNALKGRFGL